MGGHSSSTVCATKSAGRHAVRVYNNATVGLVNGTDCRFFYVFFFLMDVSAIFSLSSKKNLLVLDFNSNFIQ